MGAIASQITSLTIVYSTVYSDADQRKHQSSASLAFVRGIHRRPVNSPHKWPVTRKMFPFDDVIMYPDTLSHRQASATHLKLGCIYILSTDVRSSNELQWLGVTKGPHDDEAGGVSNHQPHDCLRNRLFSHRSKKTSKFRITGLCAGNSPVTVEFPAQRTSNAENVSIWRRHHGLLVLVNSYHGFSISEAPTKCYSGFSCSEATLDNMGKYSISQEIYTRFLLCCALLWLYIDWFSHIHQAYFTGTVAI